MKQPEHPLERFEIRLSGLGGQGILTLGKLLGYGMAIYHGYNVTQTQSYGPEARGGSSRADLVVSTGRISYPKTEKVDLLVALSQEACFAYYQVLKPDGVLLVDTTLVKQTPTNEFLGLPFTEMTLEKIKVPQAMNVVVMGAITHLLGFVKKTAMRHALDDNLPAKILPLNVKAFNLGFTQAQKHFGPPPEIWKHAAEVAGAEDLPLGESV